MEYALYNFKIYQGVDKYISFIFYSLNNEEKVRLRITLLNLEENIEEIRNIIEK